MKLKAFQHEIKDNLVDALINNVICFNVFTDVRPNIALADILPPTQFLDLFYFEDILVSSGWNGNDDIFGVAELWKAKATPLLKKIDYMHDETDIIGVMCKVKAMSFAGENVDFSATADMLPTELDLHVGGYLYKVWKDEKLQARMDDILANINQWCVSMECSFPHFDYGVTTPAGEQFIIPRNDQTSFLTKHLRIYGGVGEYEGYKIGRYLRDFIFTGKGLVKNPANKRSVITKTEFLGAAASLSIFPSTESKMDYTKEFVDALNKQVADLNATVANLQLSEKTLTANLETTKAEVSKLTNSVAGLTEANDAYKTKVTRLETELNTSVASLTKANEDLALVAQEKTKASRLSLFNDVDVTSAKAAELVDKFIALSDELFADILSAYPKKNSVVPVIPEIVTPEPAIASLPITPDATKMTRTSAATWFKSNMTSSKEKK